MRLDKRIPNLVLKLKSDHFLPLFGQKRPKLPTIESKIKICFLPKTGVRNYQISFSRPDLESSHRDAYVGCIKTSQWVKKIRQQVRQFYLYTLYPLSLYDNFICHTHVQIRVRRQFYLSYPCTGTGPNKSYPYLVHYPADNGYVPLSAGYYTIKADKVGQDQYACRPQGPM